MAVDTKVKVVDIQINNSKAIDGLAAYDELINKANQSTQNFRTQIEALQKQMTSGNATGNEAKEIENLRKAIIANDEAVKNYTNDRNALSTQLQRQINAEEKERDTLTALKNERARLRAEIQGYTQAQLADVNVGKKAIEEYAALDAQISKTELRIKSMVSAQQAQRASLSELSAQLKYAEQQYSLLTAAGRSGNTGDAKRAEIKAITQNIADVAAADTTLKGMQITLSALTLKYNLFTEAERKNSAEAKTTTEAIRNLKEQIAAENQILTPTRENIKGYAKALSDLQKKYQEAKMSGNTADMTAYNTQITQVRDNLRKIATAAKDSGSMDGMKVALKALNTEYSSLSAAERENEQIGGALKTQIQDLTKALLAEKDALKGQETVVQNAHLTYTKLKEGMRRLGQQIKDNHLVWDSNKLKSKTEEYTRMKNEVENLDKAFKLMQSKAGSIDNLRGQLILATTAYNRLPEAEKNAAQGKALIQKMKNLREEISKQEQSFGNFARNVGNYAKSIGGVAAKLGGVMLGVQTLAAAGQKLVDTIKEGVKTAMAFGAETSKLAAILQKTKNDIKPLIDQAKDLGAVTKYTATQVTQLQVELAKLGYTEPKILNMTRAVLDFATATGSSLADAASLTGATLRMFEKESISTTEFVDKMATATTHSALSFSYLQTALPIVGSVANTFNFKLEDTLALLGQLANAGFDASMAATATRNIILNLASANGELAKQLGKPVENLEDLVDGLKTLRDRGIDLNETLQLTDKRSVAAFNVFLKTADGANELKKAMQGCDGAAKDMATTMMDNLEGSTIAFGSAWDNLMITLNGSQGLLKDIVDWATEILRTLNKAVAEADELQRVANNEKTDMYSDTRGAYFKKNSANDKKQFDELVAQYVKSGMKQAEAETKAFAIVSARLEKKRKELQATADAAAAKRRRLQADYDNAYNAANSSRDAKTYAHLTKNNKSVQAGKSLGQIEKELKQAQQEEANFTGRANAIEQRKAKLSESVSREKPAGAGIKTEKQLRAEEAARKRAEAAANAQLQSDKKIRDAIEKALKEYYDRMNAIIDSSLEAQKVKLEREEELKDIHLENLIENLENLKKKARTTEQLNELQDSIDQLELVRQAAKLEAEQKLNEIDRKQVKQEIERRTAEIQARLKLIENDYKKRAQLQREYETETSRSKKNEMESKSASSIDKGLSLMQYSETEALGEDATQEKILEIQNKYDELRREAKEKNLKDFIKLLSEFNDKEKKLAEQNNVSDDPEVKALQAQRTELFNTLLHYNNLMELEEKRHQQAMTTIDETEHADSLGQKKTYLQNEIDAATLGFARVEELEKMSLQDRLEIIRNYDKQKNRQQTAMSELGLNLMTQEETAKLEKQREMAAMELAQIEKDGRQQDETQEQYTQRRIQTLQNYQEIDNALTQGREKNRKAEQQALKSLGDSMIEMFDAVGESNKDFAKAAKVIALAQIAISTGEAIAKMVAAESSKGILGIATTAAGIAEIMTNIATAIATVKSAHFAKGKVNIQGAGTSTSDSIPAMISRGESVINAKATKMFMPLLQAINDIGNGVPIPTMSINRDASQTQDMTEAFSVAAQEIRPIVSVEEISSAQNRVKAIQNLDSL